MACAVGAAPARPTCPDGADGADGCAPIGLRVPRPGLAGGSSPPRSGSSSGSVNRHFAGSSSDGRQWKLGHPFQVDVLPRDPKIMVVLQQQPHLRGDPTLTLQDTTESGSGYVKLGRKFTATDAMGLKVDVRDELARMGRVVHSH